MINYLTSILPIVIYVIILICLDSFRIVRARMLIMCCMMGILSCMVAAAIAWTADTGPMTFILEELLKASFAIALLLRRRIVFFIEALVYGATIGSGFALAENILYLHAHPDMLLGTAIFRGLSTALLHMGCTSLMAVALLQARKMRWTLLLLLVPFAIHYIYNLMLLAPLIQMAVTIVAFLLVFVMISSYNERMIYQWMDHSITFDVQLLAAIRQGRLADTRAGEYLLSIKEQFEPEVFFDIICFVQLYLELTIEGKSRMLLEQEQLAMPLTPEQLTIHREKLTELHQLRRNIGRLGELLLRPVITVSDQDLRAMR